MYAVLFDGLVIVTLNSAAPPTDIISAYDPLPMSFSLILANALVLLNASV